METSGSATLGRPSLEQNAQAAELAAKTAALPHGAPVRRGWFWWICYLVLWFGTLTLLVVALLRVFFHDGTHFLTRVNAFTCYLYLPVYLALAWAVCMRRWWLTFAALVVAGLHVTWTLPDFVRDRRFDVPAVSSANGGDPSPTVRIFFANVLGVNRDFTPIWKEIELANPDVVVLAECFHMSDLSFRQTPAMAEYIHTNGPRRTQVGEVKIFSRLPIKSESQTFVARRVVQQVDLEVGDQTLRVIGVHAPRPQIPGYDYYGYYGKMLPVWTAEKGPVVMIGDFNATQHSQVYEELEESGLRSAHEDRGRGYATTWPNGRWMLPPIRIDQAFVSPNVECLSIREGDGAGSDHRPLVLDVRVREAKKVVSPSPAAG